RASGPAARRQKPVTVGDGAGRDLLHLRGLRRGGAHDRERNDTAAVDEQHPANGTAEQQLASSVVDGRIPPHQLRKRESAKSPAEDVGKDIDRGPAALLFSERE